MDIARMDNAWMGDFSAYEARPFRRRGRETPRILRQISSVVDLYHTLHDEQISSRGWKGRRVSSL
jgi:hypothetical protein